jgi:hypothetical protein
VDKFNFIGGFFFSNLVGILLKVKVKNIVEFLVMCTIGNASAHLKNVSFFNNKNYDFFLRKKFDKWINLIL